MERSGFNPAGQANGQQQACANKGVICDVSNCKYHSESHKCTAEQILVGPSFAISSADTICATFKTK